MKEEAQIARNFVWGRVNNTHKIGPYFIIEFHPRKSKDGMVLHAVDLDVTQFHPYVDGKDTSRSYHSLDAALAGAIAYRHEGANHHADRYFIAGLQQVTELKEIL